jgi:hypothetical protein
MSASSVNWVCFPCRTALREDRYSRRTPDCPRCGKPCVYLGDRVAIPRATAGKAWAKLEEACRASSLEQIDDYLSAAIPSRLVLEHMIDALSSQPKSAKVVERITKMRNLLHKIAKKEQADRE